MLCVHLNAEQVNLYRAYSKKPEASLSVREVALSDRIYYVEKSPLITQSEMVLFSVKPSAEKDDMKGVRPPITPNTHIVTIRLSRDAARKYDHALNEKDVSLIAISDKNEVIIRYYYTGNDGGKVMRMNEESTELTLRFTPGIDGYSWRKEDQKKEPNQALEPTIIAVTSPAAQEPRQP